MVALKVKLKRKTAATSVCAAVGKVRNEISHEIDMAAIEPRLAALLGKLPFALALARSSTGGRETTKARNGRPTAT